MPVKPVTDLSAEVDLKAIDIATVLDALSDPVRLEILRQVSACGARDELSCGELELPVTKSTGSHHLRILKNAGVLGEREEGTRKYLSLRRKELERRFPGLIDSVLGAKPVKGGTAK
jgi:DNA-binding transcriptional ArsR family regulator